MLLEWCDYRLVLDMQYYDYLFRSNRGCCFIGFGNIIFMVNDWGNVIFLFNNWVLENVVQKEVMCNFEFERNQLFLFMLFYFIKS